MKKQPDGSEGGGGYLWHGVRGGVHELGQVHHALPLVLGHVDALDRGEAGIGVPEVLQLELPLGQAGPSQLHKHLGGGGGRAATLSGCLWFARTNEPPLWNAEVTLCFRRTMS